MNKALKLVLCNNGKVVKKAYNEIQLSPCPRCNCEEVTIVPPEQNDALWMVKCDDCGFYLEHSNLEKIKTSWDSQSQKAWMQKSTIN